MTCVAGIVHEGEVYLAGDSAASEGNDIAEWHTPKVFRKGPLLIGFQSSYRVGQLVRWRLPDTSRGVVPEAGVEPEAFLVGRFVPAVLACLEKAGCEETEWSLLVGLAGRLFEVHSDGTVGEPRSGYAAIGCGAGYALGSLHTTEGHPYYICPEARLVKALHAAEAHSSGVRGPFTVLGPGDAS